MTKSSKSSREQDIDERGDRSRSKESSDSGLRTDTESDGTCERRQSEPEEKNENSSESPLSLG